MAAGERMDWNGDKVEKQGGQQETFKVFQVNMVALAGWKEVDKCGTS